MSNFPIEPSAEVRALAHNLRELYLALLAEGFTIGEAMTIIGHTVAAGIAAAGGKT